MSKDIRNLNKINSFELSNFEENIFIFFPNRNDKYKFIIKGVYKIYFSWKKNKKIWEAYWDSFQSKYLSFFHPSYYFIGDYKSLLLENYWRFISFFYNDKTNEYYRHFVGNDIFNVEWVYVMKKSQKNNLPNYQIKLFIYLMI